MTKQDIIEASGSLQVGAGYNVTVDVKRRFTRCIINIFEADNTDAVLLIDASNEFNSLNRASALHNVRILCPTKATYISPWCYIEFC